VASAERKLSFDEWLALDSSDSFEQSTVTKQLSVETLEAFAQECVKRAKALPPSSKEAHDLWSYWNSLKYCWFIKKHPECIRIRPDDCMELLASKVEASIGILEDFVSLHPSSWGVGRLMLANARVKLEVMKHPERVHKLPNGNVLVLDAGYKGCGQVYTPDLNEWAGDVFTPEDGPDFKPPHPRPSWMREKPVPVPKRFRELVSEAGQEVSASLPVRSQGADREGRASRAAELALAASVGEAKYDTNEQLRIAWQQHVASQGVRCTPEEARQRFLDAYAAFKTQGIRMLNAADAAFFQTYATVYRL